ncbi:MAG: acetyl-CoA carboxylase carboxyltransferase subunit beta [Candidatus Glassbacteria bacterium]|nr:acetyl-CoA carboxylase carboxyltransferase subunit beta [Candidatus Glassbacteria bacterium]
MSWFRKEKRGPKLQPKKVIPDNLWVKCESCGEILYKKELEKNLMVCPRCDYHYGFEPFQYIDLLLDRDTFVERDEGLQSQDPLKFVDRMKYSERLESAVKKTGRNEAVVAGEGVVGGVCEVQFGAMDFSFIGGSMGSVVGEKIARSIRRSIEKRQPLVIVSRSGGARMMEGIFSLMQMAKTSAFLGRMHELGLPYISILVNPTTGGVTASFSMLGDINIAEPGALIGFAGPRVIKQTIRQDLPEGFQRSEFLLEHGMLDLVVPRKQMKNTLVQLLNFMVD